MANKQIIKAQIRDIKAKKTNLKLENLVLANVYGEGASQALFLPRKETLKLLADISESTVFYLQIDNKQETPVILSEVQKHPVNGHLIHLSLRKINLKEKITAEIEIKTQGELAVPGAVFILAQSEVEAQALPNDLPESFTIDLSRFKAIGEQFTFADLEYDRQKITLKIINENDPIAVIKAVEEEEEVAPVTEEVATETPTTEELVDKKTEA